MKRVIALGLLTLLAFADAAAAASRAWLEQQDVALGQAVTLNIETDAVSATPDLTPLLRDFELEGQSDSRSVRLENGRMASSTTFAITLRPRRAGTLAIPALRVGAQQTSPLTVTVTATPATDAASNGLAFVETEIDDASPYVQQSVGVTVRLYYAMPLVSGQLDLDPPDGALLQRVGEIVQSSREVNGRRYSTAERRFLLVPERSGELTLPGPRFEGRGAGGWMDDLLGGSRREVRIHGSPRTLQVRGQPANAPQPWLPLRDLRLRYAGAPQQLRAGEAAAFTVEATAVGATQAQLPELPMPSIPGAQVFAEPPQYNETFAGGTPQVKLTRRYSVVPEQAGRLVVPGLAMDWWDVRAGAAKTASLPDLTLAVAAGTGAAALPPAGQADVGAVDASGGDVIAFAGGDRNLPAHLWPWVAAGFAVLWLVTLVWGVLARGSAVRAKPRAAPPGAPSPSRSMQATHSAADLKRALDVGGLDDIEDALCGMARPPARDLDELLARLASAPQRDAVEELRRARWAGGDITLARQTLREAFRGGPVWKTAPAMPQEPLPPLYPR